MKRMLLLLLTAILPACYGVYNLPFLGKSWTPGAKSVPKERIEIDMRSAPRRVSQSSTLLASVPEKDTLEVQLYWETTSPDILKVDFWSGEALAKKPGKTKICAAVAYFYLPLSDDASRVDRSNSHGPKLMLRSGTSRRTCSEPITITP